MATKPKHALPILAAFLFIGLFVSLAHAQDRPLLQCHKAAQTNITAVELYLEKDGAVIGDIFCTRLARGGFQMSIETDCNLTNYPTDFNHVTISLNKVDGACVVSHGRSTSCNEEIPEAKDFSILLSRKDLAGLRKLYRNRCKDWEPPAP